MPQMHDFLSLGLSMRHSRYISMHIGTHQMHRDIKKMHSRYVSMHTGTHQMHQDIRKRHCRFPPTAVCINSRLCCIKEMHATWKTTSQFPNARRFSQGILVATKWQVLDPLVWGNPEDPQNLRGWAVRMGLRVSTLQHIDTLVVVNSNYYHHLFNY